MFEPTGMSFALLMLLLHLLIALPPQQISLLTTMSWRRGGDGESSNAPFSETVIWHAAKLPLKQCSLAELAAAQSASTDGSSREMLDRCYQEAQSHIDHETQAGSGSKSDWYRSQFQSRGTAGDRIAAAALQLSEPTFFRHMDAFTTLFDIARSDTHHYDAAVKALCAVWPKLLPHRALRRFASQYFITLPDDPVKRKKVLCHWYIEDALKRTYAQFLALAESALKDKLVARREKWLDAIGQLLNVVIESQGLLIAMIVDKMGDPAGSISHKAYHHLLAMLSQSSVHQAQVLNELEKVAFQKNATAKHQAYAVNVMNQFVFNKDERKLALRCVAAYLALLKKLIVEGNPDSTVVGAVTNGLRRAIPYAGADLSGLQEHVDAIFTLARQGSFVQRVSACSLVQQLVLKGGWTNLSDRFYRTLYEILLVSPKGLPEPSHLAPFFAMLFKALRADTDGERVAAFVHRLLERALFHAPGFACASLLLVSELAAYQESVRNLLNPSQGDATDVTYDPRGRDPRYAHASTQCLWALSALRRHSHPSVVQIATLLALGREVGFECHPLDDLTLSNFLEMICNDAPVEDPSQKNIHKNDDPKGVPVFRRSVHTPAMPRVSDDAFQAASPHAIDVGALFMHRFAVQRKRFLQENQPKKKRQKKKGEDEDSDDAEEPAEDADEDEEDDAEEVQDGDDAVRERLDGTSALFGPSSSSSKKTAKKEKDSKKKKGKTAKGDDDDEAGEPHEDEDEVSEDLGGDEDDFDVDFDNEDDAALWGDDQDDEDDEAAGLGGAYSDDDLDDDDFTDVIEAAKRGERKRGGPKKRGREAEEDYVPRERSRFPRNGSGRDGGHRVSKGRRKF